jgi:hypothetical protein
VIISTLLHPNMEVLQKTLYVTELWRNPRTGSVAGGSGRRIGC